MTIRRPSVMEGFFKSYSVCFCCSVFILLKVFARKEILKMLQKCSPQAKYDFFQPLSSFICAEHILGLNMKARRIYGTALLICRYVLQVSLWLKFSWFFLEFTLLFSNFSVILLFLDLMCPSPGSHLCYWNCIMLF